MRHKYNAKKTTVGNITFDSKAEAARYTMLRVMQSAGKIANLKLQPRYVLLDKFSVLSSEPPAVTKFRATEYVADFEYVHEGEVVTEDVKGLILPLSKLKMKLFAAKYGRLVKVVTSPNDSVGYDKVLRIPKQLPKKRKSY